MDTPLVQIPLCTKVSCTKKSILYRLGDYEFWVPKSVSRYEDGKLTIPTWLVRKYPLNMILTKYVNEMKQKQKESKMKPFNLEEALAGKPVRTRDGQVVSELHRFKSQDLDEPLAGIVDDSVHCWTLAGEYFENGITNFDLFMAVEKKQCWKNVYRRGKGQISLSTSSYLTEDSALDNKSESKDYVYIKTILIHEWEE